MRARDFLTLSLAAAVLWTVAPGAGAGGPTCYGSAPTKVGTGGSETIEGTSGPDVIVGLGGHDAIRGRGGNDKLCGEDGDNEGDGGPDRIFGGGGDDRILGERGHDHLDGGPGRDRLNGGLGGGDSWPNVLVGGPGDDFLNGGDAGDLMWPGKGDDFASGGGDASIIDDTLYFTGANQGVTVNMTKHTVRGQGNDEIFGIDAVYGSRYRDVIIGDEDPNDLDGECFDAYDYCKSNPRKGARDIIKGKGGRDSMSGVGGPDRLIGGSGKDFAWGGYGRDECRAENRDDCEKRI